MKNEQQSDADAKKFQKRCEDVLKKDMGSREFLSRYDEFMWYPAEVDVSIRRGWFYHRLQYFTVKSIDKLMRIYYGAVGGNSLLLLNIPPDKRGLFAQKDVKRLEEIGDLIRKEEALEIPLVAAEYEGETKDGFSAENLLKDKTFSPKLVCSEYELRFGFGGRVVDRLLLREDTDFSQRVEKFEILTEKDKERVKLFDGTVIGFNKIAIFDKIYTDNVILRITECRKEPYIKTVKVYEEGGYVPRVNRR
jgi:alpha-L-fucosidase